MDRDIQLRIGTKDSPPIGDSWMHNLTPENATADVIFGGHVWVIPISDIWPRIKTDLVVHITTLMPSRGDN